MPYIDNTTMQQYMEYERQLKQAIDTIAKLKAVIDEVPEWYYTNYMGDVYLSNNPEVVDHRAMLVKDHQKADLLKKHGVEIWEGGE